MGQKEKFRIPKEIRDRAQELEAEGKSPVIALFDASREFEQKYPSGYCSNREGLCEPDNCRC
jgi:hypothetical protein